MDGPKFFNASRINFCNFLFAEDGEEEDNMRCHTSILHYSPGSRATNNGYFFSCRDGERQIVENGLPIAIVKIDILELD